MVLLDFWAEWCEPCKQFAPILEEAFAEFPNLDVRKLELDENIDIAYKLRINSLPTLVILSEDAVVDTLCGVHEKHVVVDFIKKALENGENAA